MFKARRDSAVLPCDTQPRALGVYMENVKGQIEITHGAGRAGEYQSATEQKKKNAGAT